MEIKPFKIKVTPVESATVQTILFLHGIPWGDGTTEVTRINIPWLYINARDYDGAPIQIHCDDWGLEAAYPFKLPILTFDKFMESYSSITGHWYLRTEKINHTWYALYDDVEKIIKSEEQLKKELDEALIKARRWEEISNSKEHAANRFAGEVLELRGQIHELKDILRQYKLLYRINRIKGVSDGQQLGHN